MSRIFEHTDYRDILRNELKRRCRQNRRYSQTAFARDIKLRPNRLSEILTGKQGLSAKAAHSVANEMGLTEEECHFFSDLAQSVHGRRSVDRDTALLRIKKYKMNRVFENLHDDLLKVLTEWHHMAILELTRLKGFKNDKSWIARALRVSIKDINSAIKRLMRLNLLEESEKKLCPTRYEKVFRRGLPADLFRSFQLEILDKAKDAVLTQSPEDCINHSTLFCMDDERLGELQGMINRFAKESRTLIGSTSEKSAVYCLTTHLFRISSEV